jgi:hypothetical protein
VRITQRLRDRMRWAKKNGKRARVVVPVVWEWIDRLWRRGVEGDGRVVAVMVRGVCGVLGMEHPIHTSCHVRCEGSKEREEEEWLGYFDE